MEFENLTDPKVKQAFEDIYKKGFNAGVNKACDAMQQVTANNRSKGICPPVASLKTAGDYIHPVQGLADDALDVITHNRSNPGEALECLILKASERLETFNGADDAMGHLYGAMMTIKNKMDENAIREGAAA